MLEDLLEVDMDIGKLFKWEFIWNYNSVTILPEPHSSVGSVADLRRGSGWFDPRLGLPRIDDSHCDRIHSSLTAVHCFDNGFVGKQPVAWKEYCAEYWLKDFRKA